MIHLYALILVLAVGTALAYPDIVAIGQSTISTAAISYIFLPLKIAPALLVVLGTYYGVIFFMRRLRAATSARKTVYKTLVAALLLYCGFYFAQNYVRPYWDYRIIAAAIAPIPQMKPQELDRLVDEYASFPNGTGQRIFVLNALLARKDLQPELLDRVARIKDPALHEKLYSRYGLLGENRKGLSVARLVALHPNVASSTLSFLGRIDEPYLQGDVAGRKNAPLEILLMLYEKSKHDTEAYRIDLIQSGLAHNERTPPAILRELSLVEDVYTLSYVAGNVKTPVDVLSVLYEKSKNRDMDNDVIQWKLAFNENTPLSILKELSLSGNATTRSYAELTLKKLK